MDFAYARRWYETVPGTAASTRAEIHVIPAVVGVDVVVQDVQRTGALVLGDTVHRPAAFVILEDYVVLYGGRGILPNVKADAALTNRISVDVRTSAVGNIDRTQAAAVDQATPANVELGSGLGYENLAAVEVTNGTVAADARLLPLKYT